MVTNNLGEVFLASTCPSIPCSRGLEKESIMLLLRMRFALALCNQLSFLMGSNCLARNSPNRCGIRANAVPNALDPYNYFICKAYWS